MRLRQLFAVPGALGLCTAGIMARLPLSTMGLGIFLMVVQTSGRYGLAATACGVYLLCAALAGPAWGSHCDRHGQRFVLHLTASILGIGTVSAMLDAGVLHTDWLLFAGVTVTGAAMPSVGAMVRARWTRISPTPTLLPVAYALEASLDEVLFIAGPATIGLLTAVWWPMGLLSVLTIAVIGMYWLAAQPESHVPVPDAKAPANPTRALLRPGMPILVAIAAAIGGVLGATDVIVVAHAPNPTLGPLILALWALASCAGGLAYAAWSPPVTHRTLMAGVSAILVSAVLLLLPGGFAQTVAILAVGGFAFAPTMAMLNGLAERSCPRETLTGAFAWLTGGTALGAAAGTFAAGPVLEHTADHAAFLVPAAFALLAAVAGWARLIPPRARARVPAR